jgi:TatD DNase family protein
VFIDSHCHLSFADFAGQADAVLERMRAAGVVGALNVCITLEEFPAVVALAEAHADVWASVGVHPDNQDGQEPDVPTLVRLARHPRVIAIGETGLDYYRLKEPLAWQRQRFRTHIRAARESGLPLIVHTRAAAQDTLRIMAEEMAGEVGGVMHCFTETRAVAEAALDLGFHISFSGIVTFRNAHALREVAAFVPMDRLLIETDAPYLAPAPHRGRRNEPAFVPHVASAIAHLRGLDVAEVGASSMQAFRQLFNV